MKILILTARCGMGHYSCAKNVEKRIRTDFPEAETSCVDIYEHIFKKYARAFYSSYDFMVHHGDFIYNAIYKNSVTQEHRGGVSRFLRKTIYWNFPRLIADEQPDAIISTFSLSSRMVSIYKQETGAQIPLITWITDVEPHAVWVNPGTSLYVVADPVTKKELMRMGIPGRRVMVGGILVSDAFSQAQPGWKREDNRLLVMGGGLGLLPDSMRFYDLLEAQPHIQTTVVCGTNRKIYKKLKSRYQRMTVLPYVDNVSQLMHESSLLLTKPGGVTLFEAIRSEIPLAVFKPKLEQEKYNGRYIEDKGIGFVLPGGDFHFSGNIQTIAQTMDNPWKMEAMRQHIHRLNAGIQPDAVRYIFEPQAGLEPAQGGTAWSFGSF